MKVQSGSNLQSVEFLVSVGNIAFTLNSEKKCPIGEDWVIHHTDCELITPYSGVLTIRYGKPNTESWEQHSIVKEFDLTPPLPTAKLLQTSASSGTFKDGGDARGTDREVVVYCENICLNLMQAEAAGVAVVTASKYIKDGTWSHTIKEFTVAHGWAFKHISIANSDRIEYGTGVLGLIDYFQLPTGCVTGLPRFLETCGGMWWKSLQKAETISAKLIAMTEKEEGGADAGTVIEFKDGSNLRLLLDGECWDYLYNTLPDKVEVIEHRSGGFFTLAIAAGVQYEILPGGRYNRFDESDCLYNRGYRKDENGVYKI